MRDRRFHLRGVQAHDGVTAHTIFLNETADTEANARVTGAQRDKHPKWGISRSSSFAKLELLLELFASSRSHTSGGLEQPPLPSPRACRLIFPMTTKHSWILRQHIRTALPIRKVKPIATGQV